MIPNADTEAPSKRPAATANGVIHGPSEPLQANDGDTDKPQRNPVTGKRISGWWLRPGYAPGAICHADMRGIDARCCPACGYTVCPSCWRDSRCSRCESVGAHTAGKQAVQAYHDAMQRLHEQATH